MIAGKTAQRKSYLDILNIIAIIAVLMLHLNGIMHDSNYLYTRAWSTSLAVECLFYFAVPIFFMISGANLMNYRSKYDTKTFFKKRLSKILIPFIFWAIIFFTWKIFIIGEISSSEFNAPSQIARAFFDNKENAIYYFMFEIISVYMIMPLLSLFTEQKYRRTLWLIVILYILFNGLVPNLLAFANANGKYNLFSLPIGGYVVFVILGYLLSTTRYKFSKKELVLLGCVSTVGILWHYFTIFFLSRHNGFVVERTGGYSTWYSIITAIFIFVIAKQYLGHIKFSKHVSKILAKIAGCSFGIYLIHMMVMHYMTGILNANIASWQYRTLGLIPLYLISLTIVLVIKKVPFARKVVP